MAMTRARDALHLVVVQRFYVHGQPSRGDRHVYASRTRFISEAMLPCFEAVRWPMTVVGSNGRSPARPGVQLDLQGRMRDMWR